MTLASIRRPSAVVNVQSLIHPRFTRSDVLWGLGTAADILVSPRDAFDGRLHLKASLPATVLREGTLLHAA